MLQAVGRVGPSFKPPSYQRLRAKELHSEVRCIEEDLLKIRETWRTSGCSIVCDGWYDTRNRQIINVMVSSIDGKMFLKSVDTSCEVKYGEFIFEILKDAILDVGPDNQEWPHIFDTRCTCRCLDLLFEDIGKLAWIKPVLDNAVKVSTFGTMKHTVLALFRKFSTKDLIKPAQTWFAYMFIMLVNILDERDMLHSPLHAATFVLHPIWCEKAPHMDTQVYRGWMDVLERYTCGDVAKQCVLCDELDAFKSMSGEFSHPLKLEHILIDSYKRRNKLKPKNIEKLVYIHTNLELTCKIKESGFQKMEVTLDMIEKEADDQRLLTLQEENHEEMPSSSDYFLVENHANEDAIDDYDVGHDDDDDDDANDDDEA
ncbi:hypothetical protein KP509_03G025800 [Ceratopteris richardii]|uniref:DUF659 domain-containing protein n=1 Tax=Ceratopteris richardii TaxID=49495 RepID=A0A8T2V5E9_CERRI|nr:hypothetical protein KP509_03G025800 [Ceratopteris richardii]